MSTIFFDSTFSVALWIVVKATALVGVAALVQALLHRRRTSAATRHLVWTLAIAGVLLLPLMSFVLPPPWTWTVAFRSAAPIVADAPRSADPVDRSIATTSPPAPRALDAEPSPVTPRPLDFSWLLLIAGVYALGVTGMLVYVMIQRRQARRLVREATDVHGVEWVRLLADCAAAIGIRRRVRLLRSRVHNLPVALGTRRPSVVIPAIAETWTHDRRRAVILHELAHVARYDCLTQTLAVAACGLYWFHPAVWWVARRLRIERELACDDRVIAAGTEAREYAGHLLEIAYSLGGYRAPALAVSMARPRQLEGRMLAALDRARNRSVPTVRVRVAGAAIAAACCCALAVATPTLVAADKTTAVSAPQHADFGRSLEEMGARLRDSVNRAIRAAAMALGMAQDNLPGTWEIRSTGTPGTVHLRLVELHSSSGSDVPTASLEGLTAAQLTGAGGPVQFRLKRDAGTLVFEGVIRNGVGAGTFSFTPNPDFPAELAKRGFARPSAGEQYQMARHDIGFAFVDELNAQRYTKPETAVLVRAGQHGVRTTYLREMGALGYRLGSLERLITLRDHGVTPDYVRDLAKEGYTGLSADKIQNTRDHGVSPDYLRAMRDAGYGSLPLDEVVNARDHGVSAEYVRELGDAGYRKLPLDQLIRVRDHGVSPEYARGMRQLGYDLPIETLVQVRDHGVSLEFIRDMSALGYSRTSIETLVRVRDHGVTPQYAQELKTLGYDRLALDDLISLRDHGLTAERIRAANARAGTRLPIDLLKSLAAGGMR